MTRPNSWESVWDDLNDSYLALAQLVLATSPDLTWTADHYDNQTRPFWATAAFSRPTSGTDEDVVVSVDVARRDGRYVWTSDVAIGTGYVLVDGPTHSGPTSAPLSSWVGQALSDTHVFMLEQGHRICALLAQEGDLYEVRDTY